VIALATSFPRHAADHAGRFVHDLHAGLAESGCDVTTLCPATPDAPPSERTEAGEVIRVPYGPESQMDLFYGDGVEDNWDRVRRPWSKLRRFRRALGRALEERAASADLVVAHWIYPCGHVAARALKPTVPLVGVGHGADLHVLRRPLIGRALCARLRGRLTGALVTKADGAALLRRRLGLDRILIAPMGVDPALFGSGRGTSTEREGFVLGVGRLVPIKGFDLLIRAAAAVDLPLTLAGDGPLRGDLQDLAQAVGCDLTLLGQSPPERVADLMARCRVVAISSRPMAGGREEGFPVVAVEALASDAPLVATRTGGLGDLLPKNTLVPPEDVDALSRQLEDPPDPTPVPFPVSRRGTAEALLGLLDRELDRGPHSP